MKTSIKPLLALLVALSISSAVAQSGPQGGKPPGGHRPGGPGPRNTTEQTDPASPDAPRPPHRPVPPLFAALDVNKDGVLDAQEIANAPAALLTLDANKDGQLTAEEFRPAGGGPRPALAKAAAEQGDHPQRPVPPLMAALDTNGDHVISSDEINNAAVALAKLDKNGDGQLTQDELRPAGPGRGPRPARKE